MLTIEARPILYVYSPGEMGVFVDLLQNLLPDLEVVGWPDAAAAERVRHIAAWRPPARFFAAFPKVQTVFALGAGIDWLLARDDLTRAATLVRLTDAGMAQQMIEYALFGVLRFQRGMDRYARCQAEGEWRPQPPRAAGAMRVTVLGLGQIGGAVARALTEFGYVVRGWSRSQRDLPGILCSAGLATLPTVLAATDVLINLLPSTPETRGLLNAERLGMLPAGACVINAGRGEQLDLPALLALLDAGRLNGALLDVFPVEPLAASDPVWSHPRVMVTPHIAAVTLPEPAARQIAENIRRLDAGLPVDGLVDRRRAY